MGRTLDRGYTSFRGARFLVRCAKTAWSLLFCAGGRGAYARVTDCGAVVAQSGLAVSMIDELPAEQRYYGTDTSRAPAMRLGRTACVGGEDAGRLEDAAAERLLRYDRVRCAVGINVYGNTGTQHSCAGPVQRNVDSGVEQEDAYSRQPQFRCSAYRHSTFSTW